MERKVSQSKYWISTNLLKGSKSTNQNQILKEQHKSCFRTQNTKDHMKDVFRNDLDLVRKD